MKIILIFILSLLYVLPSYGADLYKINPYTNKLDNAGPYPANVGIGTSGSSGGGNVNSFAGYVGISTIGPFQTVEIAGNVGIGSVSPGSKLDVFGSQRILNSGTLSVAGNVGIAGANLTTAPLNVTGNGKFSGNVGIGGSSDSTTFDFDVVKPTALGRIKSTTSSSFGSFTVSNDTGRLIQLNSYGSSGGSNQQIIANDQLIVNAAASGTGDLKLESNSIEGVRVNNAGNVGVGNIAPVNKLDVKGGMVIGSSYAGTNTAPSDGLLSQGNIGIGTTNPTSPLSVYKTGTTAQIMLGDTSASYNWGLFSTGTSNSITGPNKFEIAVASVGNGINANGGKLVIDPNGNVGLGTYFPVSQLSVIGSGLSVASTVSSLFATTTAPSGGVIIAGNVGIGSTNPGQVLDVNGSIRSTATGNSYFQGNVGIGTSTPPNPLYVVGTPMFTTGLNIGIGTASPTRLCIANNAVTTCP